MIAYILNLLDLALTLFILRTGGAEGNPAVSVMLAAHPLLFPFVKIVVAGAMCLWLHNKAQTYAAALWGLRAITAYYGAVCLWNIIIIIFGK